MRLALETATDRASVALGTAPADAVEREIGGARRHAGALLPMIDARARATAGVGLDAVAALVLSDGPGSFTGLRVGAAVAKALVQARRAAALDRAVAAWSGPRASPGRGARCSR